ncbi:MAG: HAD family phosphatase [Synergistaceae bacterium]|jgi:HAD superfamily hydrolase (TIGR01509 family)|nr:HAD family phosphatase [Synergistaceae bacterium]
MKKKAVIFDMDGLMIDSERIVSECYIKLFAEIGKTMSLDFYKKLLGRPVGVVSKMLEDEYGDDFDWMAISERVRDMLDEVFRHEGVPLKPGLIDLLTYLKGEKYKTVIATSSYRKRVDTILRQSRLGGYFDGSVCGDEVVVGKPNPEIFLKACQKAECEPSEAYVLEDSEMGIETASAAGIDCIVVPDMKYPEDEYAKKACHIADSLYDVMEMIKNE